MPSKKSGNRKIKNNKSKNKLMKLQKNDTLKVKSMDAKEPNFPISGN